MQKFVSSQLLFILTSSFSRAVTGKESALVFVQVDISGFSPWGEGFLALRDSEKERVADFLNLLDIARINVNYNNYNNIIIGLLNVGVAPTCIKTMADLGALHTALQYACSQEESELKMGEKQLLSWENQPGYYSGLAVSTKPLLIINISSISVYL